MANITVPGASRQTQPMAERPRLPQDDSFARIAQAAEGVAQNWSQRELQDRADSLRKARVTAADELASLQRHHADDTDFIDLPERHKAGVDEIGARIAGTLPAAVREEFGLSFRDLARGQETAMASRAMELRGSAARAELGDNLTRYQNLAGDQDDDASREGILSMAAADLSEAVSAGYITAEAAQAEAQKLAQGTDLVRASRRLRDDPEGFDPTSFGNLSAAQREELTGRRENELERLRVRAEADRRMNEDAAERALAQATASALVGLPLTPEYEADLRAKAAAAGGGFSARIDAVIERNGVLQRFALRPPAERQTILDLLRRSGARSVDDADWFGRLQKLDGDLAKASEQEARQIQTERNKLVGEMLDDRRSALEAGLPYAFEEELAGAVSGTDMQARFDRDTAEGEVWDRFRAASPEGKAAITAQLASSDAPDKRYVGLVQALRTATEKEVATWDADLVERANEQLAAIRLGLPLANYDQVMAETQARNPRLAELMQAEMNAHVMRGYAKTSTSAALTPRTPEGGAPPPVNLTEARLQLDLSTSKAETAKLEATDPMSAGRAQQIVRPLDLGDPASVQARAFHAVQVARETGGGIVLTTKEERAREKERIRDMGALDRAQTYRNIVRGGGPHALTLLTELEAPSGLLWAVEAMQAGAPSSLLDEVTQGRARIEGGPAPKQPSEEELRTWTSGLAGEVFRNRPEELARVVDATKAIYAARASPTGEAQKGIWEEAFQAAMGGSGQTGGLRRVAGRLTPLPPGLSARDAEQALEGLATRHFEAATGMRLRAPKPIVGETGAVSHQYLGHLPEVEATDLEPQPMSTVWGGITSNGEAPLIGGQPVDYNILSGVSLRDMTGGLYALEVEAGGFHYLEDPATGEPLIVDLRKLARPQ